MNPEQKSFPVALITGAAQRIGAAIATALHQADHNIVVHYRQSAAAAETLVATLNAKRPNSAQAIAADLTDIEQCQTLVQTAAAVWERLDVLVNNASSFYPVRLAEITPLHWQELVGSNLQAPLWLLQTAAPWLQQQNGCVINMIDSNVERPLPNYSLYSCAKAGLLSLTRSLAQELAPAVRVNAVAPGAILWSATNPDHSNPEYQQAVMQRIPLQRSGTVGDIAEAVCFLVTQAKYVTGQVIAVDGGRNLT